MDNNQQLRIKVGDNVKMSDRNYNHLGNDVCAYSGMEGIVDYVGDDNSFSIFTGNSILVVPLVIYGKPIGVWIWLNGELIYLKGIKQKQFNNDTYESNNGIIRRLGKIFINFVKTL